MCSRLKFLYQLKIDYPSLATSLKILIMCKKKEADTKVKDHEGTVKGKQSSTEPIRIEYKGCCLR